MREAGGISGAVFRPEFTTTERPLYHREKITTRWRVSMGSRPFIVGVMGGGSATPSVTEAAYRLGRLIAGKGWVLLNGGRDAGVMAASAKGAHDAGGMTVGILPDDSEEHMSPYVHIPILTGMGNARNVINVLTSQVVVACEGGAGTLSEVALAIKCGRPVILLGFPVADVLGRIEMEALIWEAATPEDAVDLIQERLRPG
jgi:uncharacterized protein (TIGR00725 family)